MIGNLSGKAKDKNAAKPRPNKIGTSRKAQPRPSDIIRQKDHDESLVAMTRKSQYLIGQMEAIIRNVNSLENPQEMK